MSERVTTSAVEPEKGPSLLINGFLGGVVAVLVAFLPFSTVLGGAVAGYLQGPERRAGMKAGALAGLIALVPLVLGAFLVVGFLVIVPAPGGPGPGPRLFLTVAGITIVGVLGLYTVGGGALGGYAGAYLKEDRLRKVMSESESEPDPESDSELEDAE